MARDFCQETGNEIPLGRYSIDRLLDLEEVGREGGFGMMFVGCMWV